MAPVAPPNFSAPAASSACPCTNRPVSNRVALSPIKSIVAPPVTRVHLVYRGQQGHFSVLSTCPQRDNSNASPVNSPRPPPTSPNRWSRTDHEQVRTHIKVTDPATGERYGVDEPDLLLWVHCAEVDS
ncbi:oxygenase MpaB family protein, partial [Streptomyces niveus]|uniref:oxygenase MpaB family protein n=1 Tax=Streptomyces niveus TaxID=193462 RepID=UPI003F4DE004